MSESSFNTIIVRDGRINDISSKLDYKVEKGAAQNNYMHQASNSATTSSVTFSVTVPSENVIVDRNITVTTTPTIRLTIPAGVASTKQCINYGHTEAFNQFPFNSLCQNATATINQASISVNSQDILHILMRMTDDEKMSKYNCPHMSDKRFKSYADMVLSESNPLGSFEKAKGKVIPRGAHPITFAITRYVDGVADAVVTHANTDAQIATALTSTSAVTNTWSIDITTETTEPLLFLSPFLYGESNNNVAGLYGVKNMDFVFNIDSSAKRMFSSASPHVITVALVSMGTCTLNLNYLTVQESDLLVSKNVVPYVEYQRYLTVAGSGVDSGLPLSINSQAVQLSQIPNRIYIVARKPLSLQKIKDSNTFLPISSISINFNNVAGILSSANVSNLYEMSVANGSMQDMLEFTGAASHINGKAKKTAGSILVLDPSRDLCLPDYVSNGSIGQFSFQANVNVTNTETVNLAPELVIICEYNGLFITQSGTSMKQTGLLTKDVVVNSTLNQFGESSNYVKSFGAGNAQNNNCSQLKNIPLLNFNKRSSGPSGGAKTGGAMSAGALSNNFV